VWLYKARKRIAFTLLPMLFVLTITLWALTMIVIGNFQATNWFDIKLINGVMSIALIGLAIFLVVKGLLKLREQRDDDFSPSKEVFAEV
jgi:carbon starvation protein